MLRLAHLAQEDSRLPATRDTVGSLTRVVHELTSRLAQRWPVVVYSARHETADPGDEQRAGIRHVRFFPEPDRTLGAGWFRWRNRVARRLGVAEVPYPRSVAYYWTYIRRFARHVAVTRPDVVHFHNVSQFTGPLRRAGLLRDRGCALPDCDRPPRWGEIHHLHHWVDGGPTSLDNAVAACGHQHRVIHRGEWRVVISPRDGHPDFSPPPHLGIPGPLRNKYHLRP